ncbi:aldehyde-activating protein [Altererythrobacter indicus]|uniref:Aldehyde-activating protein n=1 Tax=Altericroceibacterium indicum TaxID=374177 RepID=A0A845ACH9_9SPHN|nr:GFA family protein [Altericroceibacterium indicum]MXP24888.1 aldehyde-activating protein [Altericroceibacterium indicum]
MDKPRHASCQCGVLSAAIKPGAEHQTVLCHCSDCQKRSGSPFGLAAYFQRDAVEVTGEAKEFSRRTATGSELTNGFCPQCGSTLYVKLKRKPDLLGIPVGAFADPTFPAPLRAVWAQDQHSWITLPTGLKTYQRGTDGS